MSTAIAARSISLVVRCRCSGLRPSISHEAKPPANLFYGTGIPACIIVLNKENAAARKG